MKSLVLAELPKDSCSCPLASSTTPKRGAFLLASNVVVGGQVVAARLAAPGVLAKIHRRLAVHAQAHNGLALANALVCFDIGEDGVGFGEFFWGLALSTGRSR